MKISSFYYNDMSDYDNFLEKFINDIDEKFFGTGYSSLNIGRFINFFRTEITKYIDIKFQKKVHLVVLLPKNDQPFIEKSLKNQKEEIKIYLSYDKIKDLLNGEYFEYQEYIEMLLEQIDSEVNQEITNDFNDYLIIQMKQLSELCYGELSSVYSQSFIQNNLKKPYSWMKLARQSAIFNDYYNYYKQDKMAHKEDFLRFLKMLILQCEIDIHHPR